MGCLIAPSTGAPAEVYISTIKKQRPWVLGTRKATMDFFEQVLVLQVGRFREADLWVRFLSPSRGLLTAFAFGGSRSRRRFVGCLDVFNEVAVKVSGSGRGKYLALQEGVLVRGVSRLRTDWSRFGVAVNCVRFLQSFGVEREGAFISHYLMQQTLSLLENGQSVPALLPLFFRLRLAFDQGYALDGGSCSHCGRDPVHTRAWLLLREGHIVCTDCARQSNVQRLPLGHEALAAVSAVGTLPPSGWGDLRLAGAAVREFGRAVDGFIQYHIGIAWDRGRFVRR